MKMHTSILLSAAFAAPLFLGIVGCDSKESTPEAEPTTADADKNLNDLAKRAKKKTPEPAALDKKEKVDLSAPSDVAAPPADANKTSTGLAYKVLKAGSGGEKPTAESTAEVHYTGWLVDGTKFDSSVDRGQTISFPLNGVIAGWTEGVGSMSVGGKRKLIIPAHLGYGERGAAGGLIPPGATLVFDVELVSTSN